MNVTQNANRDNPKTTTEDAQSIIHALPNGHAYDFDEGMLFDYDPYGDSMPPLGDKNPWGGAWRDLARAHFGSKGKPLDDEALNIYTYYRNEGKAADEGTKAEATEERAQAKDNSNDLPFKTAATLLSETPEKIDWVVKGLTAQHAISEIDGKIKVSGKTTFTLAMCRAIIDGIPFCDWETEKTNVVYLTEGSSHTFAMELRRAGFGENDENFHYLTRYDFRGMDWATVIKKTVAYCNNVAKAKLLVVDTIAKLGGVQDENTSRDWGIAMTPLQDATSEGLAVFIVRHAGKNPGAAGDSGRGHSSASGDVDIILNLTGRDGATPENHRVLDGIGRYPDIPKKMIVSYDEGTGRYTKLGTDTHVAVRNAESFVIQMLDGDHLTKAELDDFGKTNEPKIAATAINDALTALYDKGTIKRKGGGVRNDPFIYSYAEEESE